MPPILEQFIAEDEARGKVLTLLRLKFRKIPQEIESTIQSMSDLTALESLAAHAETCQSLEEFAEALK